MVTAERGTVKNGAATIAGQYRTQLAWCIRELGLSSSARRGIAPPEFDNDESDVWDSSRQAERLSAAQSPRARLPTGRRVRGQG